MEVQEVVDDGGTSQVRVEARGCSESIVPVGVRQGGTGFVRLEPER